MRKNIQNYIERGSRRIGKNERYDLNSSQILQLMNTGELDIREALFTAVLNAFHVGVETGVRMERARNERKIAKENHKAI